MTIKYIRIENIKNYFDILKVFSKYSTSFPFKRISHIIQKHATNELNSNGKGTITLVVDSHYTDQDCEDEFATLSDFQKEEYTWEIIGKKKLNKKVIRIDFFCTNVNSKSLENLSDENYLGFCVLMPLFSHPKIFRVSKALIKVLPEIENSSICKTFSIPVKFKETGENLIEKIFNIKAFPFQQQDTVLQSCSHVALSMNRWFIQPKSGLLKSSWFKNFIEKNQSKFPSPSIFRKKNRGLNGPQMEKIASDFSNPLYYSIEAKPYIKDPARIIYRYIKTGIPVLFSFETDHEMHCVVIIGYIDNNDCYWSLTREYYFNNISSLPSYLAPHSNHEIDWVSYFILHDDNLGPYLSFPYHKLEWLIKQKKASFIPLFPKISNDKNNEKSKSSSKQKTLMENVERYSMKLLDRLVPYFSQKIVVDKMKSKTKNTFDRFLKEYDEDSIIFEISLVDKNNYCQSLLKRFNDNQKDKKKYRQVLVIRNNKIDICPCHEYYGSLIMSLKTIDIFWINELTTKDLYHPHKKCFGEIILSASIEKTNNIDTGIPWIIFHIPGIIIFNDAIFNASPYGGSASVKEDTFCNMYKSS